MSARDYMRQMLQDMMGAEATGIGSDINDVTDERLCHYHLCGMCPHTLFANTKADLGNCAKSHSEPMREEYERQVAQGKDFGYERELFDCIASLVREVDAKIRRASDRLERDQKFDVEVKAKASRVEQLGESIGKKLAEAERLGEEGQIEKSLELTKEVDELKRLREDAEAEFRAILPPGSQQQQKLRVCEVCGSFLSIFDNDRRLADHFGGKMHVGYQKIRDRVHELEGKYSRGGPGPDDRFSRRDSGREPGRYQDDRRGGSRDRYDDRRDNRYDDRRGGRGDRYDDRRGGGRGDRYDRYDQDDRRDRYSRRDDYRRDDRDSRRRY